MVMLTLIKIASEQIKLDKRISGLLQSIAFAFSFAQDASLLSEGDDRLTSLRRTIIQLLDQLIECSLFVFFSAGGATIRFGFWNAHGPLHRAHNAGADKDSG